jgi:hypothetical protein
MHVLHHVTDSPTIISIIPTYPVTSSDTPSALNVPLGYKGTVVTCSALGWPTPTISWVSDVGNLAGTRIVSDPLQNGSAFVSVSLSWRDKFRESDVGNYTCMVEASDSSVISSQKVSLFSIMKIIHTTELPTSQAPHACPMINSSKVEFQMQVVLNVDCQMWTEEQKADIVSNFTRELMNIVSTACQNCMDTTEDIQVIDGPTCSKQVERAAIFRGTISTESLSRTRDIFCALNQWQQSGSSIGKVFYPVNWNFSTIEVMENATTLTTTSLVLTAAFSSTSSFSPLIPVILSSIVGASAMFIFGSLYFFVKYATKKSMYVIWYD